MSRSSHHSDAQRPAGQKGFTLIEIVVATALLGVIATTVLGGLLYGMSAARRGKVRADAAAWVQAELDYLRLHGYSFIPQVGNKRVLTLTTGYTTYGAVTEPRIPSGFDRAEILAENHATLPLRKMTVVLYETPSSQPYTILSTYVANFTYATAPEP
jgi:prepilin-type N-terminal cleavage/methylation domain-containing protein